MDEDVKVIKIEQSGEVKTYAPGTEPQGLRQRVRARVRAIRNRRRDKAPKGTPATQGSLKASQEAYVAANPVEDPMEQTRVFKIPDMSDGGGSSE